MLLYVDHKTSAAETLERSIVKTGDTSYIMRRRRYTKRAKKLISEISIDISEPFAELFLNFWKTRNELRLNK